MNKELIFSALIGADANRLVGYLFAHLCATSKIMFFLLLCFCLWLFS